jgi:hypothetical protein
MAQVTYRIMSNSEHTFTVEVSAPGIAYGAAGFGSEADAEAWVATKKNRALAGETWVRRDDRSEA